MIQFDKKISIDGVTVIVAMVGLVIWLSRMGATVETHTEQLRDHTQQIQKITDTENALQQNLAVLTAIQGKK